MKKKYHRIGNSKKPSIQQMLNIVENLQICFNCYCTVEITAWDYNYNYENKPKAPQMKYRLYRSKPFPYFSKETNSWPEVIKDYRNWMKGGA